MSYENTVTSEDVAVTIRHARPADAGVLAALAELDDAEPLAGDVLVAEVGGELWAARALDDGRVISDPFRPATEARALLELRATLIARATEHGRRAWRGRLPLPGTRASRLS
jgi:hypothetical protein